MAGGDLRAMGGAMGGDTRGRDNEMEKVDVMGW